MPNIKYGTGGATTAVCFNQLKYGEYEETEQSVTLRASSGDCGGGSEVLVVNKVFGIGNGQANNIGMSDISNTLDCLDDPQKVMISCVGGGETAQTLDASYYKGTGSRNGKEREVIAQPVLLGSKKQHAGITEDGKSTTLTSQEKERPIVGTSVVRRLTPLECSRLQGMPDGWCDIGDWVDENGKKHKDADSPKYKALGNGIALPFWAWLLKRISAQYERPATLGSLFDGIGSFPLAWARLNGPENCRWASEIEQHPIAVCKAHFGDEDAVVDGDVRRFL